MNRKKLIPLLLFLLLLLLIVCVWCHSEDIVKNRTTSSAQVKQDIDFNFVKKENNLELTGNFSTDKSVQVLHTAVGDAKFNNLSNINKELLAKEGVVLLTQKLLLDFNENYQSGSISYANGKLSVEGVVDNEADKDAISALLASSTIDSQNNTRVVIPGPTAEELVAIKTEEEADAQKAKLEAEEKARLEAEAEAKMKSEEEARLLALAEQEAKNKAIKEAELEKLALAEQVAKDKAMEEAKLEAQALAEKQAKAEALEAKIKGIIDAENINFEVNKDLLTTQSISTIGQIADILKKHPNINVEISGHTDNTGNSDYNLLLSQKRVNSVKEKLIALQIDSYRLSAVGYGANQPLVSNDTKENRRINRRVEFKVIGE